MQAILLQIVGLLIVITLIIMFYSKPNVQNKETKTYSKLLILNLLFILVGIITFLVAHLTGNIKYIEILQKVYLIILLLLNMYSMIYCISIHDKYKINKVLITITLICISLIIVLPLNTIFDGNLLDGDGPAYDVAIIHTIISFCFFICITIKFLINKYSIKKILPYIILILLYLVGFIIRIFNKELIFEGFLYSYVLFIMFNTIENPDVKMAKELSFQKELALSSSKNTLDQLEEISNELRNAIKELNQINNIKIDKNNIEEMNNLLLNFQNKTYNLSNKINSILELALIKNDNKINSYKYETTDMIDKLDNLLKNEAEINSSKLNIDVENLPLVLYGDSKNIIKVVLLFYDFLLSITENKKINLKINSINVGNLCKVRFNFIINDKNIQKYIIMDNKKLKLEKPKDINYEIIKILLNRLNSSLLVLKEDNNIICSLNISQKLVSEYELISNKQENQNIKIKYKNYNKSILIVNNNILKLKELKILLEPYNMKVKTASTLNEMENILFTDETFDLIFIDDIIPEDSITTINNLATYIKKELKYPIIIVILVTPNNKNYEKSYLKLGFNDYIIKPVNKKNLDDILNKYFSEE